DTSKQMSENASDISDTTSNSGVCQKSKTRKSLEDEEIDEFLNLKCKERKSEEIIQAIKEKKLWDQDLSSINQDQTRKDMYILNQKSPIVQKIEQGIIQEVILFIQKEKILTSLTNTPKTQDSNIEVSEDKNGCELAQLFSDAKIVEGKTIKAKQKEIIYWCTYRKLSKSTQENAKSWKRLQIFKKIIDPTIKKKIKGIGIDKVYRILYGTRSISELTDTQILNIINRIASIMTKNKENSHDQNYVTTETKKTLSETEKVIIAVQSLSEAQVRVSNKISNSPVYPNKTHLYQPEAGLRQYAIEYEMDPEKFSVITVDKKKR
ncbi:178_t:CDS:2, partial [Diversispora eburnea]